MRKKPEVKEKIIEVTIELIQKCKGDVTQITTRDIAAKAEVGNGLINYHFQTKENLIAICVQRIINNVVFSFSPQKMDYNKKDGLSDKERLTDWATQIFEFLFENYSISRISILKDMENYDEKTNSAYTQKGLSLAIRNIADEKEKKLLAFILVSVMQTAFLGKEMAGNMLGYDLKKEDCRKEFVENIVSILFNGTNETEENKYGK